MALLDQFSQLWQLDQQHFRTDLQSQINTSTAEFWWNLSTSIEDLERDINEKIRINEMKHDSSSKRFEDSVSRQLGVIKQTSEVIGATVRKEVESHVHKEVNVIKWLVHNDIST